MEKVVTSVKIPKYLRDGAKERNLNISMTLEEALKEKLCKDRLLEEKKLMLKEKRKEIRELQKAIKELESMKPPVEVENEKVKRMEEKAVNKLGEIYERQGGFSKENLKAVERITGLPVSRVEQLCKVFFT